MDIDLAARIRELIWPTVCVGCDGGVPRTGSPADLWLCWRCRTLLAWRDPARCPLCEHPSLLAGRLCGDCEESWPRTGRLVTLGYMAGPLARAVRVFKYGSYRGLGEWMGQVLARRVERELGGLDRIVPIPGAPERVHRRGFDTALVIAAQLGRRLGIPVEPDVIRRIKATGHGAAVSRLDREVQVRGRFEVVQPGRLRGCTVLVVDDVYTTGVSLQTVARLCCDQAGARRTHGAVLARTVHDGRFRSRID